MYLVTKKVVTRSHGNTYGYLYFNPNEISFCTCTEDELKEIYARCQYTLESINIEVNMLGKITMKTGYSAYLDSDSIDSYQEIKLKMKIPPMSIWSIVLNAVSSDAKIEQNGKYVFLEEVSCDMVNGIVTINGQSYAHGRSNMDNHFKIKYKEDDSFCNQCYKTGNKFECDFEMKDIQFTMDRSGDIKFIAPPLGLVIDQLIKDSEIVLLGYEIGWHIKWLGVENARSYSITTSRSPSRVRELIEFCKTSPSVDFPRTAKRFLADLYDSREIGIIERGYVMYGCYGSPESMYSDPRQDRVYQFSKKEIFILQLYKNCVNMG